MLLDISKKKVNEALVKELEQALADAKDGNLQGFFGVTINAAGSMGEFRVFDPNYCQPTSVVGALTLLVHNIVEMATCTGHGE